MGDVHYIEIKDDYSDLEERLNYYIEHPDEAQKIITAAHEYIDQFRNRKIEHITSMMVAEKYFNCTEE